jgi:hypothetical protein
MSPVYLAFTSLVKTCHLRTLLATRTPSVTKQETGVYTLVSGNFKILTVLQSGELGQVVELVHHLRLGLGGLQRLVHGEKLVHKKHSGKADLYIS